jgi:hypothetical protein
MLKEHNMILTAHNQKSWMETIWTALEMVREDCIPESEPAYDEQWGDICTAMAWISEALNIDTTELEDEFT